MAKPIEKAIIMPNKNNSQKLWALFTWVIVATLILSACGTGQSSGKKVYHVGIIFSRTGFDDIANAFKSKMTELGYVEGENIVYDLQVIEEGKLTGQNIAEKFVVDKVDLILACGAGGAIAAKKATEGTDIPVVFTYLSIEGTTLVNSVREPGGNITGVRNPGPELMSKRVEMLNDIMSGLRRLYIAYQADYATAPSTLEALRPAAAALGMELVETQITSTEDIAADLEARAQAEDIGIDAIMIMPDAISQSTDSWALISQFATEHNVPIVGNTVAQAKQGALFSYSGTFGDNGTQAALLTDKIFKGTPAGTIPVVTPDAKLVLNYKVAKSLGLLVPDDLMRQAVEIIRDEEAAIEAPATQAAIAMPSCAQPIKIAIIAAMSGTNAVLGNWMKQGVTLAIEQKNAAGGVQGCQVELVIYDDEADTTKSVSLAQKVAAEDKVMAAWATTNSSTALTDIPVFEQYQIPQLTNGTNATITQQGSAYIFRANPAGPAYEDPIVEYLVNQGKTKFAIIGDDSAYGKGEATYQTAALQRELLEPLSIEEFGVDDKDFTEQLTRIFQKQPEVLLLAASEVAGGLVAKQARELGFTGIIAGGSAMSTPTFLETAGDAAEGVYFTSPYPGNDANEQTRAFASAYKIRWGEDPELHGANTYDGTNMLLIAMENASPLTSENVAAEMHKICGYQGLQGAFCYDANGEGIKTTHLGVIQDGQLTYSVP
jgi:ABC-type branched-subunit amino acid transport system substrate-binding protein